MKSQCVHLSQTALSCLVAAAVASSLATPARAETFRHPKLGYTVWYPDGWKVHSPPELIEPVEPSRDVFVALGVTVLLQKRSEKEVDGLFVASTCGRQAYLGDGKILPEDHSELAVWREAANGSCAELIRRDFPQRLAAGTSKKTTMVTAGRHERVYSFYAREYWQWPVFYLLACKELGSSRFMIRIAFGGAGADVEKLLQYMARVYESLAFTGGSK